VTLAVFDFLAWPFLACLVLVGIHAYLGIHVLARGVVFVDISLAQIAALGSTVAFATGAELDGGRAYAVSLGFTFVGALLFALSRRLQHRIPQEAVIGITYAVAAAAAILLVESAPHGSEHIKQILVGNLLWITPAHVGRIALIYGALGLFHYLLRKPFLRLSFDHAFATSGSASAVFWDLLFYLSFGFVITSSVQVAGVLLVFSFLIIPAVFGALFTRKIGARLALSWTLGFLVSAAGMTASYALDLPTGAAVVTTFGIALTLALGVRALFTRLGILTAAGAS
jgi:zinc/manganese transport system permease protein